MKIWAKIGCLCVILFIFLTNLNFVGATNIYISYDNTKINEWSEIKKITEGPALNIQLKLGIEIEKCKKTMHGSYCFNASEPVLDFSAQERRLDLPIKKESISIYGCSTDFNFENGKPICNDKSISLISKEEREYYDYSIYLNEAEDIFLGKDFGRMYITIEFETYKSLDAIIKNGEASYIGWFETKCNPEYLCPVSEMAYTSIILPNSSIIDKLENLELNNAPNQIFTDWILGGRGYEKKVVFYRSIDEERSIQFWWLIKGTLIGIIMSIIATLCIKAIWVSLTRRTQGRIISRTKKIINKIYYGF